MHKMSKIDLLFDQAVQKHQAGDLAAAAIGYAAVLKENSRHSDAWHFAGLIAHQMGNSDDALQQIKYAIEIDPTNPEYFSTFCNAVDRCSQRWHNFTFDYKPSLICFGTYF